jgi:hypothetical protein
MAYDPAARGVERKQDPSDPRTYPDAGLRAAWAIAAFFVVMLILGVIALWNRSPYTSSTATGPNTTQSPTGSTGPAGAPNTGAAR